MTVSLRMGCLGIGSRVGGVGVEAGSLSPAQPQTQAPPLPLLLRCPPSDPAPSMLMWTFPVSCPPQPPAVSWTCFTAHGPRVSLRDLTFNDFPSSCTYPVSLWICTPESSLICCTKSSSKFHLAPVPATLQWLAAAKPLSSASSPSPLMEASCV